MKKTTQIHIGGRHFFIDEDAFQKLNLYLESLKRHFAGEGESGSEVVDDIEQRIAELLESKITQGKQAVNLSDVNEAISTLGNVEDFVFNDDRPDQQEIYTNRRDYRRFYRDPDNYYIGGVAGGMGEYFDIDPMWIRLAFVLLFFAKGAGLLIYLILWIVVPKARTTAEKLQMRGKPVNLSTIKETVNEEYEKVRTYQTTGPDSGERTRNAVENIFRALGLVVVAIFKFIVAFIGVIFLVIGSIFLAGLIMAIFGFTGFFGHAWNGVYVPDAINFFANSGYYYAAVIALIVLVLIPIIALIYGGVKILFNIKTKHPVLRAFLLTSWILALILFGTVLIVNIPNSPIEASGSNSSVIEPEKYPYLVINVNDNLEDRSVTHYRVMGMRFNYSRWDEALYDDASLNIERSPDKQFHLTVQKKIKNAQFNDSEDFLDEVRYNWDVKDSVLTLDKYFFTDDNDFWMFPRVDLILKVPEGQKIKFNRDACEMLTMDERQKYCEEVPPGKKWMMSPEGALIATE
ncbi:MAG TPA: PspC domain-containing protein [Bacteroidales bacterium]|nr:PspC domain-containing protein [Bacteroidales bacterium]